MTDHPFRLLGIVAVLALVGAACGGDDDSAEPGETTEPPATTEATETDEQETDDDALIVARELDVVVQYGGFEFELLDIEVPESTDDDSLGDTFSVNTTIINLRDRAATPRVEINLQWDDERDNVVQVRGDLDAREIPGGARSSGTLSFSIPSDDVDEFDENSLRMVFGPSGTAQAVAPIGDDVELVSRLPVSQDVVDVVDINGFTFEVNSAVVRWDDLSSGGQVDDGTALLVLSGRVENGTDRQLCVGTSGPNTRLQIELPDGTARTPQSTTLRCVGRGEVERDTEVIFEIDDPYDGDYTFTMEGTSRNEGTDSFTFSLAEAEGTRHGEADDSDDDSDTDDSDTDD